MTIGEAVPDTVTAPIGPVVGLEVDGGTHHELSQFLIMEARLLDERRFNEWFLLIADDVHYWMPARYNRLSRELSGENAALGEIAHFDDDKVSLGQRVTRLNTGMAWAEDPPSRTRHLVTNVWARPADNADEYDVQSYFLIYRNRGSNEYDIWAGKRDDVLRRVGNRQWQIAKRTIILDQATILSKNLSVFF